MSGIALKISSLVIRTVSKPIANAIKHQAREHEGFRKTCVAFAQALHRIDMHMRLGLLRDTAQIERQAAKEAAEAAAKKHKSQIPTVKTESQMKAEEKETAQVAKEKTKAAAKPRIRPLSEAKAIETGANFISEAFLFIVAGSLILVESYRSRRKETSRREDVAERIGELEESERNARKALVELEKEVLRLRALNETGRAHSRKRILPKEVWELEEKEEKEDEEKSQSWIQKLSSFAFRGQDAEQSIKEVPIGMPKSVEYATKSPSETKPAASKADARYEKQG